MHPAGGNRFVALHTASGGKQAIQLPAKCRQVRELFSGRIVGEIVTAFEDDLSAPDTVLYELKCGGSPR